MLRSVLFFLALSSIHEEMVGALQPPTLRKLPLTMAASRKKMIGAGSEAIVIKLAPPGSRSTARMAPKNIPESSIVRLKPVIRFHHESSNPSISSSSLSPESLYKKMAEMGLHKIAQLLQKANLTEDLLKLGPVTFFCPTDEAFSLGERGLDERLQEAGPRDFLLSHIIRGHVTPSSVRNDLTMPTIHPSAAALRFNVYNGGQIITVSGAQMLASGELVDEVFIQPIDRILYPLADSNNVEKSRQSFKDLHSFMQRSGLLEQLASGTFTIFSPSNEAFSHLPRRARDVLLNNSTLLRKLLLNHVVPGTYYSTVLNNGYRLKSLGGSSLIFTTRRGLILVNGVPVVNPDVPVNNGVLHGINRVLVSDDLIEQCQCMYKYPLVPATLKPVPYNTSAPKASDTVFEIPASSAENIPTSVDLTPSKMSRRSPLINELAAPMQLQDGRNATFKTAFSLLQRTVFFNTLRHPGSSGLSVLWPSDRAFNRLSPAAMTSLHQDKQRLTRILSWHIIEGSLQPNTLTNNSRLKVLSGGMLPVTVLAGSKTLLIGGMKVIGTRNATNGAVFAVDEVYDPPSEEEIVSVPSIQPQNFTSSDELSIWRQILDDLPDLKTQLKSRERTYTMFAVTNSAFGKLRPEHLHRLLHDETLKRDLIKNHVMLGAVYRRTLVQDQIFYSLSGNKLVCSLIPNGFVVNEVPVTRPGIVTRNGVLYVVEQFLTNPMLSNQTTELFQPENGMVIKSRSQDPFGFTLQGIARLNNATTFLKWIHASGLRDLLRPETHCTLFLPTNDAIQSMSPTLRMYITGNKKILQRTVRFHISPVSVKTISDINHQDLMLPTQLPNKFIRCNSYDNETVTTASGCPVSRVITPENAISVVIVQKPLIPPIGHLFLTMSKSPMLKNFTKIVRLADMEQQLQSGVYTVFAPSKCAFETMAPAEYERLLNDVQAAKEFVNRHLAAGCYYSKGLHDGMILRAVDRRQLTITVTDCILVNGVKLKFGDLGATNGVLHIVADIL